MGAALSLVYGCSQVQADRNPWPTSLPEAQGLDTGTLLALVDRIERGDFGAIHSLIIVRHDHLVLEAYFEGYNHDDLHPQFSVTKSVAATLIGIALGQGKIDSVGVPLMRFVPERETGFWQDARKRQITLEHVLTMTAGFAWDEVEAPYGDQRNPLMRLHASDDWIAFVLRQGLEDRPGTRFAYNSGASVLLAAVLRQATGEDASDFAERVLFGPLGIEHVDWTTGPGGMSNTAWGLSLRPFDMAKFGVLMLHGGLWGSRRIVPEGWVRDALRAHVQGPYPFSYGYQWWTMPIPLAGQVSAAPDVVFARGWGGQFIMLVPVLDLVVVSTGGNYRGRDDQALDLLKEVIARVVIDTNPH
jgi:CubicO group peptidase (beta-lactamase class C family)